MRSRRALRSRDIEVAAIGRVTEASDGVKLRVDGELRDLPRFSRDELARFLSEGGG